MALDASLIAHVVKRPEALLELQSAGVSADDFIDDWRKVWTFIARVKREHGNVPSATMLESRFDVELPKVRRRDLPILLADLKARRRHRDFVSLLSEATGMAGSFQDIDDVVSYVQGGLNALSVRHGQNNIRDLFTSEVAEEMIKEIKHRRNGQIVGFPTGLTQLDEAMGGMQKGRMITVVSRPGLGKSWLNLLFLREAVLSGGTFMLFPLEMSLTETAFRLYTLFSQRVGGPDRVIKNLDLVQGRASPKKVRKFLSLLEDHYKGQLLVADVSSMSEAYTVERIEAECEMHKPDGFWIDYITLMKTTGDKDAAEYVKIRQLSNGIAQIAMRNKMVGGCSAQIGREALRKKALIPRLEDIAYGDSIGQDSHQVISLNRKGSYLYYGLVKNRHGPEINKVRVRFFVNEGLIQEDRQQEDDDDD